VREVTEVHIDIDGTIARENKDSLLELCNEIFKLGIDKNQLKNVSLERFHWLPRVIEYRNQIGDEVYNNQFKKMQYHPEHIAILHTIADAVEGVNQLHAVADDLYYNTCRFTRHTRWNADIQRMTHFWLETKNFPNHEKTIFCEGYHGKLVSILSRLRENSDLRIILIDDNAEVQLQFFDQLARKDQEIVASRLVLVGFSFDEEELLPDMPIRLHSLEKWQNVKQLIEKEFKNGGQKQR
jgi:uncharacterized HAD superfamily protein